MATGSMRLHVALLGCGIWGRNILRDLLHGGCRVSVVEPDPAARSALPRDDDRVHLTTLGALAAVDGSVVATPASTHAAVVRDALAFGVPVYCESP